MKKNPSTSKEDPKTALTGQSSIFAQLGVISLSQKLAIQSTQKPTKKQRMAEKKKQKIDKGILKKDPSLLLDQLYEGKLQRSKLLSSFKLQNLSDAIVFINTKNKSFCPATTIDRETFSEEQQEYRIFLHFCVMNSLHGVYQRQCSSASLYDKVKFYAIGKMFEYVFQGLLNRKQQEISYTKFQLQNCQQEVAMRWTFIYLAFDEFYKIYKNQQIDLEEVSQNLSENIQELKYQWTVFSIRKSQIYKYQEFKDLADQTVKLVKSSKSLANMYRQFILKVWEKDVPVKRIIQLNQQTLFQYIDFRDQKTQGLTTHNCKFYSFINMYTILKKIKQSKTQKQKKKKHNKNQKEESQQEVLKQKQEQIKDQEPIKKENQKEKGQQEVLKQKQEQIKDQEPIKKENQKEKGQQTKNKQQKNLINLIKMYVFVVTSHQLAHSLVRKIDIPEIKQNDDSASAIKECQEGGNFFQKFLFGERVSVVTGQNFQKIQEFLKFEKPFDYNPNQFKVTREGKKNNNKKVKTQQIQQISGQDFQSALQIQKQNIALSKSILKNTKYSGAIKTMVQNEGAEKIKAVEIKPELFQCQQNSQQQQMTRKVSKMQIDNKKQVQFTQEEQELIKQFLFELNKIGKLRPAAVKGTRNKNYIRMKRKYQNEEQHQDSNGFRYPRGHNSVNGSVPTQAMKRRFEQQRRAKMSGNDV